MKFYSIAEVIELGLNPENINYYPSAVKLCAEVSEFYPAEVLITISLHDGKYYLGHCYVHLKDTTVYVSYYSHKKRYSFVDYTEYPTISRYEQTETIKHIKEPNYVGKLSTKKITEWVNYYNECNKVLKAKDDELNNNVQTFLDSIKDENVQWWNNKNSGEIVKNGIVFSFNIENGWISKKIEVHYSVSSDLDTFKKLSDNKF